MATATATDSELGTVHPRLQARLRQAQLFGAFSEVTTPRFHKYLLQPKHILRNGWLLDPHLELDQRSRRAYVLGHLEASEDNPQPVGQRLEIDRHTRQATLVTVAENLTQTIRLDLASLEVIDNQIR